MFSLFFTGLQQDLKIFCLAPIVCAIFRLAFILVYSPQPSPVGQWRRYLATFRYGFWWGMDFNAYVFLYSLVLVSLPAAFTPEYYAIADTVRAVAVTLYLAVLYLAFMGKMIFYYHFHDTFNQTVRLGLNADKKNFADIFFNQNHGALIIVGFFIYTALMYTVEGHLLATPTLSYLPLDSSVAQYALNVLVVLAAGTLFYFLRYGGTLNHRKKPEWDDVPILVKDDMFLSKATVDDLIALELALKHPLNEALTHTDAESAAIARAGLGTAIAASAARPASENAATATPPAIAVSDATASRVAAAMERGESPLPYLVRRAQGARITPPQHIFILIGESHGQAPFDPFYRNLHLMEASERWRA